MAVLGILQADHSVLYGISSHQVWRPGVYESVRAATYAFHFMDEELKDLQASANRQHDGAGGVITFAMLQAVRQRRKQHSAELS